MSGSPNLHAVNGARHLPSNESVKELEKSLAAGLLREPDRIGEVSRIFSLTDLLSLAVRDVVRVMLELHQAGGPVTLPAIRAELDAEDRLQSVGGAEFLGSLVDPLAGDPFIDATAKLVRRYSVERRIRDDHQRLANDLDNGEVHDRLRANEAELQELEAQDGTAEANAIHASDLARIGFSGERLLSLLKRSRPEPIQAGIPVSGHFQLLIAPAFTGKSSLAYWLAMARAAGMAPWDGVPAFEPGRVLIFSLDEAPEQAIRRMNGLSLFHAARNLQGYASNLTVIGPDREVDTDDLDGLRFDEHGLATITRWLEEAIADGCPFKEVYIDAYADILPLGQTENSNEEATRIGGALERLAVRTGAAIVLLHHAGKPPKDKAGDDLPDLRYFGRGASALAAKARIVTSLEVVRGMPHLRRVRTIANLGRPPRPALFEVCSPESDVEELIHFRPHDPLSAHDPHEILTPGEEISTNDLAWRLSSEEPANGKGPSGDMKRLAAQLRERWRQAGLVEVTPGPRGAKLIKLYGTGEAAETRGDLMGTEEPASDQELGPAEVEPTGDAAP